ncbi:MAG: hypothetical protein AAFQ95_13105 [Cyanobacteria bacterium J06621_3]
MERWSELVAGYVLGNLTDEEQQELSKTLRDHPQLRSEISRLQKTATMSRAQSANWMNEKLAAGAQGWTDTAEASTQAKSSQGQSVQPAFPEHEQLVAAVVDSANAAEGKRVLATVGARAPFFPFRFPVAVEVFLQRTSVLSWLVAFVLVGVSIDNWRVRRLLAIAEERILQLELSVEYSSGSTK